MEDTNASSNNEGASTNENNSSRTSTNNNQNSNPGRGSQDLLVNSKKNLLQRNFLILF